MTRKDIKALFGKFGASISEDDVWQVQSATVIKHKALERLAAAAGIEFKSPHIIRSDRDEAVILVTGTLGERSEWSIGEALVNVNYRVSGKQAAYVYAMAEKRAKDRVIIKLAGLHGIFSEDEADDFKARPESAMLKTAKEAAQLATTKSELRDWFTSQKDGLRAAMDEADYAELRRFVVDELAPKLPESNQEEAA